MSLYILSFTVNYCVLWFTAEYVLLHLEMQQHDVNPKMRLSARQAETRLGVEAVVALQRTGEGQLGYTSAIRV